MLTIQDKLGLLLYLSINRIMKRLERLVFVLFTSLMCSDSIFNLLKRVTDGSFYFYAKRWLFLFYLTWIWASKFRCPPNWHTDLKSGLDQPLLYNMRYFFTTLYQPNFVSLIYHFVSMYSIIMLALPPQYSKSYFGLYLPKIKWK